ncbi:hypothetical protein FPOA_11707 [Fusarium poae]|uniref:Aminoglycoside phosphotransferase domain-containing protein n=1 Tax=Fusarium poae TaxID=36050 RepID=A0A1B8AI78_FUSPO|nr:hypothetical protein FPOA_11707 [Fusarium poae]
MITERVLLEEALNTIHTSNLRHPDNQLLECFLEDSADPNASAQYIFQNCPSDQGLLDFASLLSDWKSIVCFCGTLQQPSPNKDIVSKVQARDSDRCCLTRLKTSFFDPLIVMPIPRIVSLLSEVTLSKSQFEMLQVFLGSDYNDLLNNAKELDGPQNYWLVRRSAAIALSNGYFSFIFIKGDPVYNVCQVFIGDRNRPSILDKIYTVTSGRFEDRSESGIPLPDISSLKAFSRFVHAIRWYQVSIAIVQKQHKPRTARLKPDVSVFYQFCEYGAVCFSAICRLTPSLVRVQIYRGLWFLGAHLYGQSCSFNVQRLPFGIYLKKAMQRNHQSLASEYGTLQSLRRLTHIPVPRPLDLVSSSDDSYLLTTRLPGHPVGSCLDTMSDGDVDAFIHELQGYLSQLRAISKPDSIRHAICNAVGGPCYDYRTIAGQDYDEEKGDLIEPFANEEDFNKKLQTGALPRVAHESGHKIVFTHGDINMRNILMHNGRISGIVDWENAGWFPDYWEYTKALFVTRVHRRWLRIMDRVFPVFGDFKDDLAIERQLWEYCM